MSVCSSWLDAQRRAAALRSRLHAMNDAGSLVAVVAEASIVSKPTTTPESTWVLAFCGPEASRDHHCSHLNELLGELARRARCRPGAGLLVPKSSALLPWHRSPLPRRRSPVPGHRDPGAGAVNSGAGAAESGAGAVAPAPPHGDGPGGAGPAPRSRLWAKTTCVR